MSHHLSFKTLNDTKIRDQLISLRYESSLYIVSRYHRDNEKGQNHFCIHKPTSFGLFCLFLRFIEGIQNKL